MNLRSFRAGLVLLAAAAIVLAASGAVFSQRGPIKIGLLVPSTGPLSANGKEMANGITLYLEEQNHQLAGREAKLIVEDTEGKPPIALNKARALAESHGVHVIVGPLATAEAYALRAVEGDPGNGDDLPQDLPFIVKGVVATDCPGDIDGDGRVGNADLQIVLENWANVCE